MGEAMASRLLQLGPVVVWNRSKEKCDALAKLGATVAASPADVVRQCDLTIAMLSDPAAAEAVALGPGGAVEGLSAGKGYIDMSTVDAATSSKIAATVAAAGGRFLEAPVSGSKQPAQNGQLVILAAGEESLFADAAPAFGVLGKRAFYLGAVGAGARMKLVVNMVMGSMMASFAEGMALAEASGLAQTNLVEVLSLGAIANPMFAMKAQSLQSRTFPPAFPLRHQQKDLRLALELGQEAGQALPVAAAANEAFKAAVASGLGDADFAAVYNAVRPAK